MQQHYNRKQRRGLARSLNLLGNNKVFSQWTERVRRSIEAGKQIDRQFKNIVETNLRNNAADKEVVVMKNLTASVGEDVAALIMSNNRRLASEREAKLAARRKRQQEAYSSKTN